MIKDVGKLLALALLLLAWVVWIVLERIDEFWQGLKTEVKEFGTWDSETD